MVKARASSWDHGLSITAWMVGKGGKRFILTGIKKKKTHKPPNLTQKNKTNPNKYLTARKAF